MNRSVPAALLLAFAAACNNVYYATMGAFGYGKRDLLVERVQEVRAAQSVAVQQIQATFAAFQAMNGLQGGGLEARYREFRSHQENSVRCAREVEDRIAAGEQVAGDMWTEWGQEIAQIENQDLRQQSEQLKADTEARYRALVGAMKSAEVRMQQMLTLWKDQVLFLKRNLDAAAINSLQGEATKLQTDVAGLVAELQKSIDEADKFIASLPKQQE